MTNEMFEHEHDLFSDNDSINELARESIEHISKVYPIYVMFHYHNGEPLTKEQTEYLDILYDLVSMYDLDITLVVNEQDAQTLHDYDDSNEFKYLVHSCYDSKDELSNNISKIKNFILKSAASRFGNKNISWIYLIEEGVKFYRKQTSKYLECKTAVEYITFFSIWQYLSTKKVYAYITDENDIGMTGVCNILDCDKFTYPIIDKYLCSGAMLINLSECNRKHIEFDLMNDVLDDVDLNVNMFANGLHVVALPNPLGIENTFKEYRSNRKLSNLALNLWAKWGDKVVQNLVIENNQIKPKFASDFSGIVSEFNSSSRHRMFWPKNEKLLKEYMSQKKKMHVN